MTTPEPIKGITPADNEIFTSKGQMLARRKELIAERQALKQARRDIGEKIRALQARIDNITAEEIRQNRT